MWIYLIILLIIYIFYYNYNKEHFNINDMGVCNECSYKSKIDCMMCHNCVYCTDEYGNGKSVSGDTNGPFFESCNSWNNTNNIIIDEPIKSYYTYQEPNYRRYYGNNQGRRQRHHVF
jgi:hypothetical protein